MLQSSAQRAGRGTPKGNVYQHYPPPSFPRSRHNRVYLARQDLVFHERLPTPHDIALQKCRDYGSFKNPHNNIEVLRFVANPEDPPCGRGVYRNISWHARYFNGSWKRGVKASPGHFWRGNYAFEWAEVQGVLTPESPWWKATPEEARAAQSDNAVLIEHLHDGTRKVFVLAP